MNLLLSLPARNYYKTYYRDDISTPYMATTIALLLFNTLLYVVLYYMVMIGVITPHAMSIVYNAQKIRADSHPNSLQEFPDHCS